MTAVTFMAMRRLKIAAVPNQVRIYESSVVNGYQGILERHFRTLGPGNPKFEDPYERGKPARSRSSGGGEDLASSINARSTTLGPPSGTRNCPEFRTRFHRKTERSDEAWPRRISRRAIHNGKQRTREELLYPLHPYAKRAFITRQMGTVKP